MSSQLTSSLARAGRASAIPPPWRVASSASYGSASCCSSALSASSSPGAGPSRPRESLRRVSSAAAAVAVPRSDEPRATSSPAPSSSPSPSFSRQSTAAPPPQPRLVAASSNSLSDAASATPATAAPVPAPSSPPKVKTSEIVLNDEQHAILQRVLNGHNCFFTGSAGTGKSVLLRGIVKVLREQHKRVFVTATTGIAAQGLRAGLQTLTGDDDSAPTTVHSFAGLNQESLTDAEDHVRKLRSPKANKSMQAAHDRILGTDVLVIDEISMMHHQMFTMLDRVARILRRKPDIPFGGIQLIVAGDFFQLPPVTQGSSSSRKRSGNSAPTIRTFAFDSASWAQALPAEDCFMLKTNHRQGEDRVFAELLDRVRFGRHTEEDERALAGRVIPPDPTLPGGIATSSAETTELHPRRDDVDRINKHYLSSITDDPLRWISAVDDYLPLVERQRNGLSRIHARDMASDLFDKESPAQFLFKVGALVMVTKNLKVKIGKDSNNEEDDFALFNGMQGKVVGVEAWKPPSTPVIDNSPSDDGTTPMKLKRKGGRIFKPKDGSKLSPELEADIKAGRELPALNAELTSADYKAVVSALRERSPTVYVEFEDPSSSHLTSHKIVVPFRPHEHKIKSQTGSTLGSRWQVPLQICKAMTIHKSQGQTLARARADLSGLWEPGQAYVALSRCRTLLGLELVGYNSRSLRADKRVVAFYRHVEQAHHEAAEAAAVELSATQATQAEAVIALEAEGHDMIDASELPEEAERRLKKKVPREIPAFEPLSVQEEEDHTPGGGAGWVTDGTLMSKEQEEGLLAVENVGSSSDLRQLSPVCEAVEELFEHRRSQEASSSNAEPPVLNGFGRHLKARLSSDYRRPPRDAFAADLQRRMFARPRGHGRLRVVRRKNLVGSDVERLESEPDEDGWRFDVPMFAFWSEMERRAAAVEGPGGGLRL